MKDDVIVKEKLVVEYFKEHPNAFIGEVAFNTGVSKSSVQRYLQKYVSILIPETGNTIGEQLQINRLRGQRKGGIQSFKNNDYIKDEKGHFIGSESTVSEADKEEKKCNDIKQICTYYLADKTISLTDLAHAFTELYGYSRDYVYDCLLDSRVSELLDVEKALEISKSLHDNRMSFYRKMKDIQFDINTVVNNPEFTLMEKKVFIKIANDPEKSLQSIGEELGVSKTTVMKYENGAITKINEMISRGK